MFHTSFVPDKVPADAKCLSFKRLMIEEQSDRLNSILADRLASEDEAGIKIIKSIQKSTKINGLQYSSFIQILNTLQNHPISQVKNEIDKIISANEKDSKGEEDNLAIPDVRWEDVGGLEEPKKEIRETISLT